MTRHHLQLVSDATEFEPAFLPDHVVIAAHEFLRKPRTRDYPYDVCIDLLKAAIRHHVSQGNDPWSWTQHDVDAVLSSWWPAAPLDAPERLRYLPDLLDDFIGFVQRDRVPPEESRAISATIDRLRPEFLCAVGAYGWETPRTRWTWHEPPHPLQDLADLVGGLEVLERLDAVPLPDEPFAWAAIPGHLVPAFEILVPLLDDCADAWFTVEHRTALRRFAATVAVRDIRPLQRGDVLARAAAIAWVVLRANDDLGPGGGHLMTAKDLSARFGLGGGVGSTGRRMLRAGGGTEHWSRQGRDRIQVGDARLLTSRRRAQVIADRERRTRDRDRAGHAGKPFLD